MHAKLLSNSSGGEGNCLSSLFWASEVELLEERLSLGLGTQVFYFLVLLSVLLQGQRNASVRKTASEYEYLHIH